MDNFKSAIDQVIKLGAKYIHFDVMDEEFIGHTSFSYDDFKKIIVERVARMGKILKAHKVLILKLEIVFIACGVMFMVAESFIPRKKKYIKVHT